MSNALSGILVAVTVVAPALSAQEPSQPAPVAQPAQSAVAAQIDSRYLIDETFTRDTVPLSTPGLQSPVAIRETRPAYTPEAMRARLQGEVMVSVRVGPNGLVEDVRVTQPLDPGGLDSEAMAAALKYSFAPALLNGVAVPCIVQLRMQFRLH